MDAEKIERERIAARSRRAFVLGLGGAIATIASSPMPSVAATSSLAAPPPRSLALQHLHTGESLQATYWRAGEYDAAALNSIDHLLRDFRTGDTHPIERRLLELLHVIQTELGTEAPYQVIGGYRSPKTNEMLRAQSSGVAAKSLHMEGRAIDVRIRGLKTAVLREAAADLRLGGVGYYRSSDFVHIDTGRPRVW